MAEVGKLENIVQVDIDVFKKAYQKACQRIKRGLLADTTNTDDVLEKVTATKSPTGDVVYEGLEADKYIAVSPSLMESLMESSRKGEMYPYRVHGSQVCYSNKEDRYYVLVRKA